MHSATPASHSPGGSLTAAQRFHGLDWLRAAAALLVVALHAGIAYTLSPFPGLAWPTHDGHPSGLVDALTWWINGWIMPAFLILGGFVAAPLLDRLGPAAFLRHRARRLLVPLLFGCLVILPLDFYIWLLGWVIDDRIPLKKLRSLKLGPQGDGLWGVGHLWFLQYLFLFSAAAAALAVRKSRPPNRNPLHPEKSHPVDAGASYNAPVARANGAAPGDSRRADAGPWASSVTACRNVPVGSIRPTASPRPSASRMQAAFSLCAPLLFAIPGALALAWEPRIVIGFRHSWYPLAANLLYYAPCFAAGWWLARCTRSGAEVTRHARLHLGLSLAAFVGLLPLLRQHVAAEWSGLDLLLLTSLFSAFAWLIAWGAVCFSLNQCGPPPSAVRYLSGASFWIYLAHHPAVGLAQVALMRTALPAAAKFCIVFAAATALSLLTYEACVRRTWIGALLNGQRETSGEQMLSPASAGARRAA